MRIIILPWPPSINHYWRHTFKGNRGGRVYVAQEGVKFRESVQHICAAQKEPRLAANELVRVEIIAAMPDRRRRDLDNIQKAILDALTHAGVWEDDSQVDDIRVFRARAENGELIIKGLITVVIIPILKPNVEQCHSHGKM